MSNETNLEEIRENLGSQFKQMGFSNFDDILQSARPLSGFARPTTNNQLMRPIETLYLDDINPRAPVDYSFTLERSGGNQGQRWQITSISAFTLMDTVRNERGQMLIQQIYKNTEGPFPGRLQMEADVLEVLKAEEAREKLHRGVSNAPTATRNRRRI